MYAMRMAAFALGLMAAGTALAQTAQAPSATTPPADPQQQQQMMPPGGPGGPGMGQGMGRGMGMGPDMGPGGGRHMGGGHMMKGGPGMGNCGQQQAVEATPETVKANLEQRLQRKGNPRLKVGEVTKQADGTILATIVTTKESAVVDKFVIDPKTHQRKRVD